MAGSATRENGRAHVQRPVRPANRDPRRDHPPSAPDLRAVVGLDAPLDWRDGVIWRDGDGRGLARDEDANRW